MAGMKIEPVKVTRSGAVDLADLSRKVCDCMSSDLVCCVTKLILLIFARRGWQFRVGTCNADSLTGRAGEVVEALSDRKVDVACIQETRWKGTG